MPPARRIKSERFDNKEVFFSGRAFRDNLLIEAKGEDVMLTTFTISLFTNHTIQFFVSLAEVARSIRIIAWCDPMYPHGDFRDKLKLCDQLVEISRKYEIRVHPRMHAKVLLLTKAAIGWAGSLNMVDPIMTDVMLRMSAKQYSSVSRYAEKWWEEEATTLAEAKHSPMSVMSTM